MAFIWFPRTIPGTLEHTEEVIRANKNYELLPYLRPDFLPDRLYIDSLVSEEVFCLFFTSLMEINSSLRHLTLNHVVFGDSGIDVLVNGICKNHIESLSMSNSFFSEKRCSSRLFGCIFSNLPNLSRLYLEFNGLREPVIASIGEALCRNSLLTQLSIIRDPISAEGCRCLAAALRQPTCSLMSLSLSKDDLDADGIRSIAAALPECRTLQTLDLSHNSVGPKGAKALSKALIANITITELNLARTSLQTKGIDHLVEALTQHPHLRILSLAENSIGTAGLRQILEIITSNRSITSFDLSDCAFGPKELSHVLDAVAQSRRVQILKIGRNRVGRPGARLFAKLLQETTCPLVSLHVPGCELKSHGVADMCAVLSENTNIRFLDMSNNDCKDDDGCAEALAAMLTQNTTLSSLDVSGNGFSTQDTQALFTALNTNRSLNVLTSKFNACNYDNLRDLERILMDNVNVEEIVFSPTDITDMKCFQEAKSRINKLLGRNKELKSDQYILK